MVMIVENPALDFATDARSPLMQEELHLSAIQLGGIAVRDPANPGRTACHRRVGEKVRDPCVQ
jgi:hypothetical protein